MLQIKRIAYPPQDFLLAEPEGYSFYRAFQDARIDGFQLGYLEVRETDQRLAVIPYFLMDFPLNTMLPEGIFRRHLDWAKINMACVGHPSTDFGRIDGAVSTTVLSAVTAELGKQAALVSFKGFNDDLPLPDFVKVRGLPVPVLSITPDYYANLPQRLRNELRRKRKLGAPLRFMEMDGFPQHESEAIYGLYMQSYRNASVRFECLNRDYFRLTGPISKYLMFYENDTLIGFGQVICKSGRMVTKYLGMDRARAKRYGLYFNLCLNAIDICIRDELNEIELGVMSYDFKCALGSRLIETSIYYRHNNPAVHYLLKALRGLFEPSAEDLK
jgi:hypothetical protein